MRFFCLLLGLVLVFPSFGQGKYSTDDKKAIKLYLKGNELVKARDFEGGIELIKKAVNRDPEFNEAYWRLGGLYHTLAQPDSSFSNYVKFWNAVDRGKLTSATVVFVANLMFDRGRYAEAMEAIEILKAKYRDVYIKENLLASSVEYAVKNARVNSLKVSELPPQVNRFYTQYFPALTIDGSNIFFTGRKGIGYTYDEDIYHARLENGEWTEATSVSNSINSAFNEGACTISADGRTLIFTLCEEGEGFGSCDLYISKRNGMVWSKAENMGEVINSKYWDSQPSISADGSKLYFVSNRPGGKGKRDIWRSMNQGESWTKPENLGRSINSSGDETTPFIHVNNKTLFFATDGKVGFGGHDLFITNYEDSVWSEPINCGPSINDHNDQLSMIITVDGRKGYYAQEYKNKFNRLISKLVVVDLPDSLLTVESSYVTGRVRDAETKRPIAAQVQLYDLENGSKSYGTTSDPVSGKYFFVLNQGSDYGAYVTSEGYLFEDFHFQTSEINAFDPDTIDIYLNPIKSGMSLTLENIYFELDSYEISEKSKSELDVISTFLKENDVEVEISGHTDNTGLAEYNMNLSLKRAKSVYQFLIRSGVSADRLNFKGYGATRPLFAAENDQYLNRRIEFLIISAK
ncbi:MAG: OmpA family protein [Cyclobacteriaceae bacterium]